MERLNRTNIFYRIAKGFISFFMLFSAWFSYTHGADLLKLGFPNYFRIELVVAKVIGAVVLLLPFTSVRMKDWVYAGFLIAMISALIAHVCNGDPLPRIVFVSADLVLVFLAMRYVSKTELSKINTQNKL